MIFIEKLRRTSESVFGGFRIKHEESIRPLRGQYRMILRQNGLVIHERTGHNIIVNSASVLIARLLKDSKEPDGGITYLAVGTGAPGWNLQNPPQPTNLQTQLNAEIARKAFSTQDVTFIDPETGNPTTIPTNVIDFTATFAETEAVGALVEMGLFGGDATDLVNSGSEINYRTFPVINKTNSMTLTIIFRITC
jgi:predicted amidohydrolase YtcJ